jgi:hypothetical protein
MTEIQFEKDTLGRNVCIDLKKYGKHIDTEEFESDRQRGLTSEEFKKEMYKRIDAWQDKN